MEVLSRKAWGWAASFWDASVGMRVPLPEVPVLA